MSLVKVINLERSADRRVEFARNNPRLDYQFVKAVDGVALTMAEIAATGLFRPDVNYTAGAYGVAFSHHGLWEDAIRSGQSLTIAEDDAVFRSDFAEAHIEFLAGLRADWDIVLWGWNFNAILALRFLFGMEMVIAFKHSQTAAAIEAFQSSLPRPAPFRLEASFGLPCYSISPEGARKFKAGCFPIRKFSKRFPLMPEPLHNYGIDIAMCNIYPRSNAYTAFPPLVVTRNDHTTSTIQNSHYIQR